METGVQIAGCLCKKAGAKKKNETEESEKSDDGLHGRTKRDCGNESNRNLLSPLQKVEPLLFDLFQVVFH